MSCARLGGVEPLLVPAKTAAAALARAWIWGSVDTSAVPLALTVSLSSLSTPVVLVPVTPLMPKAVYWANVKTAGVLLALPSAADRTAW